MTDIERRQVVVRPFQTPGKELGLVSYVIQLVAEVYDVSPEQILSRDKTSRVALARQVAMRVAKECSGLSTSAIGHRFDRHHTTVMHAFVVTAELQLDDIIATVKQVFPKHRFVESVMRDAQTPGGVWLKTTEAYVPGDETVTADNASWKYAAILRVLPEDVPFRIGWRTHEFPEVTFYSVPVEPRDGLFAMRIGDKDVWFVVYTVDAETQLSLEVVERVRMDDPHYTGLPLY